MWKEAIYHLLKHHQIAFETKTLVSPFEVIFLTEHQLFIHFISLQTFQTTELKLDFFKHLSEDIQSQHQRIIHLWEDVWNSNSDLVSARILAMCGYSKRLNARHCFVERIDNPTAEVFLNANHLQGSVKSKFKYGLFLKAQYLEKFIKPTIIQYLNQPLLIAVATFSAGRAMKYGERAGTRSYELLRFATLKKHHVVGGMDKLLKAFINEHEPDDVMSYADRDWSDGRSYKTLGFQKVENTDAQQFWLAIDQNKRFSINQEQDLTERGFIQIFNAGSIKYIKTIHNNKATINNDFQQT
ncbi:hypothetical protein VB264_24880 [Arcicella aquatica]|uniref:GNAT family N-acetyltransferase n=1 Tax=Arcicella aquatica TaxID=217141 RepID=A0ABU5QW17_9BACT|nr:hypothetical protein [Arcicella aquatica]MEA5261050.1 hypothetical protein [Arcicella aquatica]